MCFTNELMATKIRFLQFKSGGFLGGRQGKYNPLTHSLPDFSRRHHLHTFSQNLKCGWENIWRKVGPINHLDNVSSNIFQNILSFLADVIAKIPKWGWMSWGRKVFWGNYKKWWNSPKSGNILKIMGRNESLSEDLSNKYQCYTM
jgi:hypothetical protein